MADEFIKGFGVLTIAGLAWMTLSGWYTTPGFEDTQAGLAWMTLSGWYTTPGFEDTQLLGAPPADPDVYGQIALLTRDALFWFAVIGALTFWVVIPAINRYRGNTAEDRD